MNREHLYRGKTDDGEWVYGNLIETREEYSDEIVYAILKKTAEHRCCGEYCNDGWHSVIKETIGEFTGLTDKNGKKIFEGDIVRTQAYRTKAFSVSAKEKRFIGVVKYFEHKFNEADKRCSNHIFENGYKVEIIDDMQKFRHGGWSDFWDCDVIGNIYDNPELLTDKT